MNWKELKFDKEELFKSPPIFNEVVTRFQDVVLDPNLDPIKIQFQQQLGVVVPPGFNFMANRFNKDVGKLQAKNYWQQMDELVKDAKRRTRVLDMKDEYRDLEDLEPLQKNNLPFYYIRPSDIQKLKKLS